MKFEITRCPWAGTEQIYIDYHDKEWGIPLHDDQRLFEMLILEGMQAGLSWITILKKRENFRKAFDCFDAEKIALYDNKKIDELLQNSEIIRNRLKINAAVKNARAFLETQKEFGSFDKFIWNYVDGVPVVNHFKSMSEIPANTPLSDKISRDLKKRGFSFVGTTIIYSFLQAIGMVDDHLISCPYHTDNRNQKHSSVSTKI